MTIGEQQIFDENLGQFVSSAGNPFTRFVNLADLHLGDSDELRIRLVRWLTAGLHDIRRRLLGTGFEACSVGSNNLPLAHVLDHDGAWRLGAQANGRPSSPPSRRRR